MRFVILMAAVLAFCSSSCRKTLPATMPAGTYKGNFKRSSVNNVSDVTITFSSGGFQGQSQYFHYPDICMGTFSIEKDIARFENSCFYTAEFDWSYILGGNFQYIINGDSLILTRSYGPSLSYTDVYALKKQ